MKEKKQEKRAGLLIGEIFFLFGCFSLSNS
jgi:hypothetical protein